MTTPADTERFLDMVPFYVNGTLAGDDLTAFTRALQQSEPLQSAVERETALQSRFNAAMAAELGSMPEKDVPAQTQSLVGNHSDAADSDNLGNTTNTQTEGGLAHALSFLNPANWKPAVTLVIAAAAVSQSAIIGTQAVTIASLETQNEDYRLAAGKCADQVKPSIILEPAANASWSDLNALIAQERLSIVGGGQSGPLMMGHADKDADIDAIIDRLNASGLIASASKAS